MDVPQTAPSTRMHSPLCVFVVIFPGEKITSLLFSKSVQFAGKISEHRWELAASSDSARISCVRIHLRLIRMHA